MCALLLLPQKVHFFFFLVIPRPLMSDCSTSLITVRLEVIEAWDKEKAHVHSK